MRLLLLTLWDEEPESSVFAELARKHPHDEILSVCFRGQGLTEIQTYLSQIDHLAYSYVYVIGDFHRLVFEKSSQNIERFQQANYRYFGTTSMGNKLLYPAEPFIEQLDVNHYNRKMLWIIQLIQREYPNVKWIQIQGKHGLAVIEPLLGLRWQEDDEKDNSNIHSNP